MNMLEDQGKVVSSSFSNTEILNDYIIDNVSSDDYLETIEFKTIKRLLRCDLPEEEYKELLEYKHMYEDLCK